MFNRWLRRRIVPLAAIAAAVLLALYVYVSGEGTASIAGDFDPARAAAFFQTFVPDGDNRLEETADLGGKPFRKAAQNDSFSLWLAPDTGQIALRDDKGGGKLLTGNPGDGELARETVKGQWRSHLTSPLLFKYLKENETKETYGNLTDTPARVEWRTIPGGVGVRYAVEELGFSFYVEYTLHEDGISVSVPEHGVLETKAAKLVSVELQPFFGAAFAGTEEGAHPGGYVFVPDGPGGLISFAARRNSLVTPYDRPVYGSDRAVPQGGAPINRTPVDYPVFGMNRGENGFVGVIERGAFQASIYASPAGVNTSFHQVGARFALRRPYEKPTGLNKKQLAYESSILSSAMGIRYIVLRQGDTDYVAMAKAYRRYLAESLALEPMRGATGEPPLYMDAVLAASEPSRLNDRTVVATKPAQVREMIDLLRERGVTRMEVGLIGWNNGGFPGSLPDRFPVEAAIGGERELRGLLAAESPGQLGFHLVDSARFAANEPGPGGGFGASDAVRTLDRRILRLERTGDWYGQAPAYYFVRPEAMEAIWEEALPAYGRLGAKGVGLVEMEPPDGDYGRDVAVTREQSAVSFRRVFERSRQELDRVVLYGGPAYALGAATHFALLPLEGNYDFVVDEQVPFYPIVLRGFVTYSTAPGNARGDRDNEFLRAIEYGALPHFIVTAESPGLLKRTYYSRLYSSRFADLQNRIVEEYRAFADVGRDVWGQPIAGHRRLSEGVYETVYEKGRTVWVNYNDRPFVKDGQRVEAKSFKVVKEGEPS